MEEVWLLILVLFFATNSLENAESVKVKLEELPHKIIDEIFGEGWWDNDKDEEWNKLTLEHNLHHQIDQQNTQLGQIEPNSTDQLGQIEPNSTDQNPPLTESDNSKNSKEHNEIIEKTTSNEKFKIVAKFHEMKEVLKQKGKYSAIERTQIEMKIAKHLKLTRSKIYEWKKEFGLSQKMHNFGKKKNEQKHLIEKFDQRKSTPNLKYSDSEQKELMKRYYEIKGQNPIISDEEIAKKMLKIGTNTLYRWKKQFKRQKFHPNVVDGHSVEVNAGSNVQKIGRFD